MPCATEPWQDLTSFGGSGRQQRALLSAHQAWPSSALVSRAAIGPGLAWSSPALHYLRERRPMCHFVGFLTPEQGRGNRRGQLARGLGRRKPDHDTNASQPSAAALERR